MVKAESQKRTADEEIQEMPSGDSQRTWFPEMIVRLRSEWHFGTGEWLLMDNYLIRALTRDHSACE